MSCGLSLLWSRSSVARRFNFRAPVADGRAGTALQQLQQALAITRRSPKELSSQESAVTTHINMSAVFSQVCRPGGPRATGERELPCSSARSTR